MKWILGVGVVALVVGMAATMTIPAQTVTPDQTILQLFPAETLGVGSVDVAGLRNAPLFNELVLQKLPRFPHEVNDFVQATGFDLQRDVDSVTAGKVGAKDVLVVVRARYDKFKVEQYVKDKAEHIGTETYLGRVIYTNPDAEARLKDSTGGVSFIDNLIIAGNLTAVKQAIDRLAAPAPNVSQNSELMDQIRSIEAANQIWAVGKFDPAMFGMAAPKSPNRMEELVHSLSSGAYQMRIDQDVHVKATGYFTTPEMAKATTDMLKGLVAMAKLQVSQQEKLVHLLDGVGIDNSGATLTVNFNASGDLLKQLQSERIRVGR